MSAPVQFTGPLRQVLRQRGFFFDGAAWSQSIADDLHIETPTSVSAELGLAYPLRIGAFTHLNGGFIRNATIGRYCSLARDVQIGHGFHPVDWLSVSPLQYNPGYRGWLQAANLNPMPASTPFQWARHTTIGSDVWIGHGAFIQDGVSIGHGAIIGARAVVTRDMPPYAIVAGNPARQIRSRFPDAIVERLLRVEWWRYAMPAFGALDFSDIHHALDHIESLAADGSIKAFQPEVIDKATILLEWHRIASGSVVDELQPPV